MIRAHLHTRAAAGVRERLAQCSCSDLLWHGLRRTNEDKRKAVLGVLALKPDWSDRAIAKHVGVSDKTVATARASHCGNSAVTTERTYITKHGTTATMDTSGQKEAGKAKKATLEENTGGSTAASQQVRPLPRTAFQLRKPFFS